MLPACAFSEVNEPPFELSPNVLLYRDIIKSKGIGSSPSEIPKSDNGNDMAILAALVDSLRNFGEGIHIMKRFVEDYESGISLDRLDKEFKQGRINQAKLNKMKNNVGRQYELTKRYRNMLSKYVVKSQTETSRKDEIVTKLELQVPGKFQIQSQRVLKDLVIYSDETVLRADYVEIKVKDFQILTSFKVNDYKTLMILYREMGLLKEIKENIDNTVEFTTIYHRSGQ